MKLLAIEPGRRKRSFEDAVCAFIGAKARCELAGDLFRPFGAPSPKGKAFSNGKWGIMGGGRRGGEQQLPLSKAFPPWGNVINLREDQGLRAFCGKELEG